MTRSETLCRTIPGNRHRTGHRNVVWEMLAAAVVLGVVGCSAPQPAATFPRDRSRSAEGRAEHPRVSAGLDTRIDASGAEMGGERAASLVEQIALPASSAAEPTPTPYRLVAGDSVRIDVLGREDLSLEVPVPPSGRIQLPIAGEIDVLGQSTMEVGRAILDRLAASDYLIEPQVNVVVTRFAPRRVFVLEGVRRPQAYELPVGRTLHLTQVLSLAGGLSEGADATNVTILRRPIGGPAALLRVDLRGIFDEERLDLDPRIQPGDSIIVRDLKQGESVVYVTGRVRQPGAYRFSPREGLTVFQAIVLAGGLDQFAKPSECLLLRRTDQGRESRVINLEQVLAGDPAADWSLQNGDLVFVPESFF